MSFIKAEHKQALSGSVWTILGYGTSQVIRLGSNLILAYLLFPAAFGIMALVAVVMQGIQMFSDVGIGPSIIQNKRGEDPAFLRTAYTIQVIRGFILWGASCLLAWPAAEFFGATDPLGKELLYILPVVGVSAAIAGFTSTCVFTLNRRMEFAKITFLELIPQIIALGVQIVWAWIYPTIWALVGGWILASIIKTLLSHFYNKPQRDGFGWDRESAHELMHFGSWIFLSTIMAFLAGSLDRLALGRLLTLTELGLYSISLSFARVGVEVANRLANTVLFPILSRHQEDPDTLVRKSIAARTLILLAGGAMVSAFAIFAPVFFEQLYDKRYLGAGTISQWLAIYIWALIVLSSMERVPLALGHAKALFVSNAVVTGGYALAVPGYRFFGMEGFILGLACAVFLAHTVLLLWVPNRRMTMFLQTCLYTVGFGGYVAGAIWLTGVFQHRWGVWADVSISLFAAAVPCLAAAGMVFLRLKKMRSSVAL